MIRVDVDRIIGRPIDDVFDRLVNISNYANWLPKSRVFLDTKKTSTGPVAEGTTFIDETRIGTYKGVVTELQRPTKVSFRMRLHWLGDRIMESRPEYTLEPVAGGTQVHHFAEGELFGIFKLLRPFVVHEARIERTRTIDALKRSLELPS